MVTSVEEAAEIAAAAEKAPGKVMAAQGYGSQKEPDVAREHLAAGDIGELQAVKVRFRKHLPEVIENREHSIYALPHSILLDMSVHHVDLLRFMTQHEVTSVVAVEHDTPDNAFKHPSNALCLMRLEGGIPVIWDGDWCARGPEYVLGRGVAVCRQQRPAFLGWRFGHLFSNIGPVRDSR